MGKIVVKQQHRHRNHSVRVVRRRISGPRAPIPAESQVISLRGKATAIAVPSLIRSVVVAATARGQIRIVLCLRRPKAVIAHRLNLLGVLRNRSQIMREHARRRASRASLRVGVSGPFRKSPDPSMHAPLRSPPAFSNKDAHVFRSLRSNWEINAAFCNRTQKSENGDKFSKTSVKFRKRALVSKNGDRFCETNARFLKRALVSENGH